MSTITDHIACAGCLGRIKEYEPDLVLRRLDGSELRFFHTRCGRAASRIMHEGEPNAWWLTVRHVYEEEN